MLAMPFEQAGAVFLGPDDLILRTSGDFLSLGPYCLVPFGDYLAYFF